MEFNPSLKITLLSAVDPGSLILLGDTYGFCIVSEGDPAKQRAVILYDGTAFRYEVGVWPAVVDFGKSYTVSPTSGHSIRIRRRSQTARSIFSTAHRP